MLTSIPDLQAVYDGGVASPLPAKNKNHVAFPDRPSGIKTIEEEDWDMFYRYWKYVRKYRKKRDFKKARYWLGEMRNIKRFLTTTVEERYPEVYSKCHSVISFMFNEVDGMRYNDVSDMASASEGSIKSILMKAWKEVSGEYITDIYNNLLPEAKKRGYHED